MANVSSAVSHQARDQTSSAETMRTGCHEWVVHVILRRLHAGRSRRRRCAEAAGGVRLAPRAAGGPETWARRQQRLLVFAQHVARSGRERDAGQAYQGIHKNKLSPAGENMSQAQQVAENCTTRQADHTLTTSPFNGTSGAWVMHTRRCHVSREGGNREVICRSHRSGA